MLKQVTPWGLERLSYSPLKCPLLADMVAYTYNPSTQETEAGG